MKLGADRSPMGSNRESSGETNPEKYAAPSAEFGLIDLWMVVAQRKRLVLWITALTTSCALLYAVFATPVYRAEVLMAPAGDRDDIGNPLSFLPGQLGGFADLVGFGSGGTIDSQTAIAILESRQFIGEFIDDRRLMPILFADRWDVEKDDWKEPTGISRVIGSLSALFSNSNNNSRSNLGVPTTWDAYELMRNEILSVSLNEKTGLITLVVEWEDPKLAADWANAALAAVNEHIRTRDVVEAERSIEFLTEQLDPSTAVSVEQAIYSLIEEQTKTIMLANVREEYAFEVIDRAVIPQERVRPDRVLTLFLGLMVGLVLGSVAALLINLYENKKSVEQRD